MLRGEAPDAPGPLSVLRSARALRGDVEGRRRERLEVRAVRLSRIEQGGAIGGPACPDAGPERERALIERPTHVEAFGFLVSPNGALVAVDPHERVGRGRRHIESDVLAPVRDAVRRVDQNDDKAGGCAGDDGRCLLAPLRGESLSAAKSDEESEDECEDREALSKHESFLPPRQRLCRCYYINVSGF